MLARLLIAFFSYPFDWQNPFGYFLAMTFAFTLLTYTLLLISAIASFGIGCYLLAITVTNEVKSITKIATTKLRLKTERSLALSRFVDLIEWHSKYKKLGVEKNLRKN